MRPAGAQAPQAVDGSATLFKGGAGASKGYLVRGEFKKVTGLRDRLFAKCYRSQQTAAMQDSLTLNICPRLCLLFRVCEEEVEEYAVLCVLDSSIRNFLLTFFTQRLGPLEFAK